MSKPSAYLGLDPGKEGAVAVISAERKILLLANLPFMRVDGASGDKATDEQLDFRALSALIAPFVLAAAAVERPKCWEGSPMSKYAHLSLGITYGLCVAGVAAGLGEGRLLLPYSAAWKKRLGLKADKELSKARAYEVFKGLPTRMRDDKAEALLLADYALRQATEPQEPVKKRATKSRVTA